MQEAVPVGVGAMAAVLGLELDAIQKVCESVRGNEVCSPANINAPNQVVIAGHATAIDRAVDALKQAGAKRVVKLNVSAPFHCQLMKPAQDRLAGDLERLSFADVSIPVITNVDAAIAQKGVELRDALVRQVSSPVRWLESMRLLIDQGVDTLVEVGPGKVLTGLMRQISRDVNFLNVEDAASLHSTMENLQPVRS
jgi:[acyl-carrier-protein] S-malonyltransferase